MLIRFSHCYQPEYDFDIFISKQIFVSGFRKDENWSRIERLEKNQRCHHCYKNPWQHPLRPVCKKCQPTLRSINCQHCKKEFHQHRMLQRVRLQAKWHACMEVPKADVTISLKFA